MASQLNRDTNIMREESNRTVKGAYKGHRRKQREIGYKTREKHGSKACVTEATKYQICGERASGGAGGGAERRQEVKFGVRHY